jgi:Ca2+-binding EF-hand superfamily protein
MSLDFASKFSEKELDKLYADFLAADADNSGSLDFPEFYQLLAPHVKVEEQATKLFGVFDKNQDGQIDIKEFVSSLSVATRGSPTQKLEFLLCYPMSGGEHMHVFYMCRFCPSKQSRRRT